MRRIRLIGVASAAAVMMALVGNGSHAADPWTPVPASFFGMHIHQISDYPTVPIGALGKGSCTGWNYVEPSRGVYNWSAIDAYVGLAQHQRVDFIYTFYGVPAWAASNPGASAPSGCNPAILINSSMPANIQDFKNYVTALVTRYKGRIQYYELWNEPYQELTVTIPNLVALTTSAYNIIRSIDPAAKIITPSMSGEFASYAASYFAAGGPTGVDIASLHAYPDPSSPTADVPEIITADRFALGPLLPVLAQYLPHKPLWDTEGGWGYSSIGSVTTPAQQAAFIARWYLLHWSSGITRAYWYAWDDSQLGTLMPSLLGSSVPATAFQQVQNWLIGRTMSMPCSVLSDGMTWTCQLSGANGYNGLIVWNTAGPGSYVPPSAGQYNQYRDLSGNVTSYAGYDNAAVPTGIEPILVED